MNAPPIKNMKKGPEAAIQDAILKFLRHRGWLCLETHGNMYMHGFPDIYATHSRYRARFIEVKNPESYSFTPAQLEFFPKFEANGTGIWILGAATEAEYEKLFAPPNWHIYLINLNHRHAR